MCHPAGEWLHLVPRWHPGSDLLPWWLCAGGIGQRAEALVLRDQPGEPDYLWDLDPRRPAGNTHPTELCQPLKANRRRSFRSSFATFSMWTCHSEGRDRPWGESRVSDSNHPLSWMCCGFVRLCFCCHVVKLSAQVGHHQTFSLYMCLCLCSFMSKLFSLWYAFL